MKTKRQTKKMKLHQELFDLAHSMFGRNIRFAAFAIVNSYDSVTYNQIKIRLKELRKENKEIK